MFEQVVLQTPPEILHETKHRPYPLPDRPWVMAQTWQRLLFAHWSFPAELIAPLIPPALTLDTFGGRAWVGVVPFRMNAVRWRGLPPIIGTSKFPELNVRTYVRHGDYAGVWFFSLDAANLPAVVTARMAFHLPYYQAKMAIHEQGFATHYASERTHRGAPSAHFEADYHPLAPAYHYADDSLERWLTERYCLFAYHNHILYRGDIQHEKWQLHPAEATIRHNTMLEAIGLPQPTTAPHVLYVEQIDVLAWYLTRMT